MPEIKSQVNNSLMGAAGVHFVVAELSRRGLIALPTIRNTAGIDVVVVSQDGSWHANLQIKTSRRKVNFWPIGRQYKKMHGRRNYFAFVRYLTNEERFEVFLESAQNVAKQADKREEVKAGKGTPGIGPSWHLSKETAKQKRLRANWLKFGQK